MRDNKALCWFLGAIPAVLSSFFTHFLKSQDKRVLCYTNCAMLKFPLDEVEEKPPNFNGSTGEKLTMQIRCLNFLSLTISKESDLGTELYLRV